MPPSSPDLFTREEVLGGLPARRARTLLFLIESHTARLTAQAKQAMARYRTERAVQEDELAFFSAFTEGREPPLKPAIQDIEHFSTQWAHLVPAEPRVKAALSHALAEKYHFTYKDVPGIRSILSLDDPKVQQAFLSQFHEPLSSIYQESPSSLDRIRWQWTRLAGWIDSLPPFWTSFALTFTETVGSGILALPIAFAGLGPLPGIFLLSILGLINVLTVACSAEAAARSGTVRYGSGFMGRMVNDYLGSFGSSVLTVGVAIFSAIQLFALNIGFGAIMTPFTGLPQWIWMVGLFIVGLYFLRRESLNATIASALLVGFISIIILFLLIIIAFTQLNPGNLFYSHIPFINGEPFKPAVLELMFGVVLASFFGHLSVNNCARVVLRRDPSARSLIGGAVLAQLVSIGLYSIWTVAVAGAVSPTILEASPGTALEPLALRIGPFALVVSTIYAVLTLAMGSIYNALCLFNLVSERLPSQKPHHVTIPCNRGRLVFTPHSRIRDIFSHSPRESYLHLTYLGLKGSSQSTCPRLRLDLNLEGEIHSLEITPGQDESRSYQGKQTKTHLNNGIISWDASEIYGIFPGLQERRIRLTLTVLEATSSNIRLAIMTPMMMRYEGEWENEGLNLDALLNWSETERRIWKWISQQLKPTSLAQIAIQVGIPETLAESTLKSLLEKRQVSEVIAEGQVLYRARFAARRGRTLPVSIESLGDPVYKGKSQGFEGNTKNQPLFWVDLIKRSRYWICAFPTIAIFIFSEISLMNGQASFSEAYSLSGVLLGSLLAGFFPILLITASRRKGDVVPLYSPRLIGNWIILAFAYLVFLSGVLIYGLVIWQQPIERLSALTIGLLAIVMPVIMLTRGAFRRRAVIELCASGENTKIATYSVSAAGHAQPADVCLHYKDIEKPSRQSAGEINNYVDLKSITVKSPSGLTDDGLPAGVKELKIWAHQFNSEGEDHSLPVIVKIIDGKEAVSHDLDANGGQMVLPLASPQFEVEISFEKTTSTAN